MAKNPRADGYEFGGDSFMDIVANVVGILIILIVVVSMRIQRTPQQLSPQGADPDSGQTPTVIIEEEENKPLERGPMFPAHQIEEEKLNEVRVQPKALKQDGLGPSVFPGEELSVKVQEALQLVAELQDLLIQARRLEVAIQERSAERQEVAVLIKEHEQKLAERQAKLSREQQEEVQMAKELAKLDLEIAKVDQELRNVQNSPSKVVALKHDTTPISETVYGDEIHLQLLNERLAVIPIDALLERVKHDIDRQRWKVQGGEGLHASVGPIDGFRLDYTITARQVMVGRRNGQVGTILQVTAWELVPQSPQLGETVEQALAAGSRFRAALSAAKPDRTAVTVWVYPNGFDEFRRIKEELNRLGFATAGRPLPPNTPISGSPHGSRSSAQ